MGTGKDMKATAKNIEGKVQETTGNITGDKKDQLAGKVKQGPRPFLWCKTRGPIALI